MVAPPWGNNDELWQPRSLLADGRVTAFRGKRFVAIASI